MAQLNLMIELHSFVTISEEFKFFWTNWSQKFVPPYPNFLLWNVKYVAKINHLNFRLNSTSCLSWNVDCQNIWKYFCLARTFVSPDCWSSPAKFFFQKKPQNSTCCCSLTPPGVVVRISEILSVKPNWDESDQHFDGTSAITKQTRFGTSKKFRDCLWHWCATPLLISRCESQ